MTLEKEPDPLRRIPTKHTADLRAEIGSLLRAARLKRGQSLDAVAQQTRISKRFLEALENDRFEQFPAVVYLRGFLKGYCEHLELDFDQIWSKLEQARAEPAAEAGAPAGAGKPEAAGPAPASPRGRAPVGAPGRAPAAHGHASGPEERAGAGASGAIALAVALALGLALWLFMERRSAAPAAPTSAPVALQPVPRSVEPKLVIRLKNDAWLRVVVDGQAVFEGRAPRGAAQEWTPAKWAGLRTTDPAALELELNGSAVPLGAPGSDGEYRVDVP